MIDTDTRQMRRGPDGLYYAGGGKRICDHCGHVKICDHKPLTECGLFLPAIPFTDEVGLEHVANTVRVGMAWTQRLQVDQIVALYNSKNKEIFGHARVLHAEHGPIADMLKKHAHANHIMLDTPRQEAAVKLLNWMRKNYGPRIIHEKTRITAVYILREHQPPAAPNFKEHEARR